MEKEVNEQTVANRDYHYYFNTAVGSGRLRNFDDQYFDDHTVTDDYAHTHSDPGRS
jgi:hypothetical protein